MLDKLPFILCILLHKSTFGYNDVTIKTQFGSDTVGGLLSILQNLIGFLFPFDMFNFFADKNWKKFGLKSN